MWKLFIDDVRDPITDDWVVCRTSEEAILKTEELGCPNEIAFDHDLGILNGEFDTTMRYIYALEGLLMTNVTIIPEGFKYSIHSSNPVGVDRIRSEMELVIKHFGHKS
jgi:hypothetical protein